jgi:hypothetical protein
MGLFIGAIGKSRSFILKPRDAEMHLPTDLLGVNPADYDANRSDGDLVSATNRACALIKSEVERIGLINHATLSETRKLIANPTNYELSEIDFRFLGACLQSHTANPIGLEFYRISNNLRGVSEALLQIASIKLERMGLLSKTIETNGQDGYDYYAYSITEIGIDALLKNEHIFHPKPPAAPAGFDDIDF